MRAGCGASGRTRPWGWTPCGLLAWAAASACWAKCCARAILPWAWKPITGFANAVVSAAIEFKAEGRVLGTGAKMFTIAGPVIVYGTLAAVVYGAVLWVLGMAGVPVLS